MSFKIVQTIENKRILLCTVPSAWETDGILRWPLYKHKAEKLRRDPLSTPKENWKSINCIVKRSDFPSFESAESASKIMSDMSDTETEYGSTKNWLPSTYQTQRPQTTTKENQENFNDLILFCNQKQSRNDNPTIIDAEVTVLQTAEAIPKEDDNLVRPWNQKRAQIVEPATVDAKVMIVQSGEISPELTQLQHEGLPLAQEAETTSILTSTNCLESKLEALSASMSTIQNNQEVLCSNQIVILQKLANISTQFEEYMKKTSQTVLMEKQEQNVDSFKLITNKTSFDAFEESIKNKKKKQEVKKSLSVICGQGKGKAITNAYALSDAMFDRKFLLGCSWAGGTRAEGEKICFKSYQNTLKLFFEIIHMSDTNFTTQECSSFFKNILRNAKKRCETKNKRMSHQKKRGKKTNEKTADENEHGKENQLPRSREENEPTKVNSDVDDVREKEMITEKSDEEMSDLC